MSVSETAAGKILRVKSAALVACALVVSSLTIISCAQADEESNWTLDPEGSELSFVTVKASDIAEVHNFGTLSGGFTLSSSDKSSGEDESTQGELVVDVHLDTVETNIPIRNERIREFLFETTKFPLASVRGQFPAETYLQLPVGGSVTTSLELVLDLHGQQIPVTADVLALRLGDDRLMATSIKPIVINAASVDLVAGIDKLQQLASLPSISKAVPVSFVLTFVR